MRSLRFAAVAAAGLLLGNAAEAISWVEIARGTSTTYYLDPDSVRRSGEQASATVRVVFDDLRFSSAGLGYTESVGDRRFNCSAGTWAVTEYRLLNSRGRVVTNEKLEARWQTATSGSVAAAIVERVCSRKPAEEAPRPGTSDHGPKKATTTQISKDDEEEWHLADDTVAFTGARFVAVVFQLVKPYVDEASRKEVHAIGWRVEGDCAASRMATTLKRVFDGDFELIRELTLSEKVGTSRQYADGTIAFHVLKTICARRGLSVVAAAGEAGSLPREGSSRPQQSRSEQSSGTGFAVTANGRILTNNHVVKDCSKLWVSSPGTARTSARVVAHDDRNDLALVEATMATPAYAAFRTVPVKAGESVVALGFPLKGLLASEVNVSTGTISALAGIANDTTKLQLSAPIQPGNSGGPLLDATGAVSAVVVEKLDAIAMAKATGTIPEGISFAIKGDVATLFLRSAGIEPRTSPPNMPRLEAAEVAQGGKPMTFLLECEGK